MTSHLNDEQLLDYCAAAASAPDDLEGRRGTAEPCPPSAREVEDYAALEQHLRDCPECRARCQSLRQVLALAAALPVPEPDAAYESRVWRRIRPQLAPRAQRMNWREWFTIRRLVSAGAVAALILAAFLAGRYSPRPGSPEPPASSAVTPQVRERILLVAVGDHLDRAQSVLLEISNTEPVSGAGSAPVDISREQQRAEQLLTANRLYRQTAGQTGDAAVASVLEQLEPLLAEIANSPGQVPATDLEELRRRIAARGLLLKVRVLGSAVRERQQTPAPPAQGKS